MNPSSRVYCVLVVVFATTAHAEGWGHVRGRFVFGGDPPTAAKLELNKDIEICSKHDPRDESVVVDPKSGGVANIVLWLDEDRSDRVPAVHESYAKAAGEPVVVANGKCRFAPHVGVLRTGAELRIVNDDPVAHAAAFYFFKNDPINVTLAPGGKEERTIAKGERLPVKIVCPIHSWMKGWLIVRDHPYVAVTGVDGSFELKNLPAGEWTFQVWHETVGNVDKVTIDDEPTRWTRGRLTIDVPADGTVDLGTVTIDAEEFVDE